jgi:hypothetical protein
MNTHENFKPNWIIAPPEFLPEGKTNFTQSCCSICNKSLKDETFMVEKSFWQDKLIFKKELIFEIFICYDCIQSFNEQISEESKIKMEAFRQKNFNHAYRQKLHEMQNYKTAKWLKYCEVTKQKIADVQEFNIVGLFFGENLIFDELPMAISLEGLMQLEELYSKKTRDALDDFINALPPNIRSSVKDKSRIFL